MLSASKKNVEQPQRPRVLTAMFWVSFYVGFVKLPWPLRNKICGHLFQHIKSLDAYKPCCHFQSRPLKLLPPFQALQAILRFAEET